MSEPVSIPVDQEPSAEATEELIEHGTVSNATQSGVVGTLFDSGVGYRH
jgi:hypothetical protein